MKEKYDLEATHIISEPGDCTRYDYGVLRDGEDFVFFPCGSTFRYPQRINAWDVKELSEGKLIEMAKKENCNPHTLAECIRTIFEMMGWE